MESKRDNVGDLSIEYFLNLPYLRSANKEVESSVEEDDTYSTQLEEREKMLKMRKKASKKMFNLAFNRESNVKDISDSNLTEIRSFLPSKESNEDTSSKFFHLTEVPQKNSKKKNSRGNVVSAGSRISRAGRHFKHVKAKVNTNRKKKDFEKIFINHAQQKEPVEHKIPKTPEAFNKFVRRYVKTPRIDKRINKERLLARKEKLKILHDSKLSPARLEEEELILDELDLSAWETGFSYSEDTPTSIKVLYNTK